MFISFEGIEGVGKSTQLTYMAKRLSQAGIPVVITREPGGTPLGEELRDIILAHRYEGVAVMSELLLMFAARAQHIKSVIRPALANHSWVLCDRFIDATYAYQGGGRGIPMEVIARLEEIVLEGLKPDCVLIFDAPATIGLERVEMRNSGQDRFEQEKVDFFERVREVYKIRAKQDLNRYKIIDAKKSLEEVQEIVLEITQELINREKNVH